MIYSDKQNIQDRKFIDLLKNTKILLLKILKNNTTISSSDFEKIVYEQMIEASKGTDFENTIKLTGTFSFPDIIANKYFGVEVKMTIKDQWTSTGNSILETTRIEDVEKIYILFGKFGGTLNIQFRLYQECLTDITVTHSPRYKIDMDLDNGNSIFDKIGIEYDKLRKSSNTIQIIKDYYRNQLKSGEELWWIDQENEEKSVSPIIKPFRSLTKKDKENFLLESMIFFPEIFGKSTTKFERVAAYLIAEYNSVTANLRDVFTAGGKIQINIFDKPFKIPQLVAKLYFKSNDLKLKIFELDEQKLKYYWRCKKVEKNRLIQWKRILNRNFFSLNHLSGSKVFDAGLQSKAPI